MIRLSAQNRMIVVIVLAGVALTAVLWITAIGPKRTERGSVTANVSIAQQRMDEVRTKVADYTAARKQFAGMMSELKRLDVAVPSRGAISQLLRQLQRRARASHSNLQLAALKTAAAAAGTTAATPGASSGPSGLATLPFTFQYTGDYFDLVAILRAVRSSVEVRAGDLKIDGRLLTIDGVTFQHPTDGGKLTQAIVSATAYIAPDAASPAVPAPATNGGS